MILSRRTAHLYICLALTCILPTVFIAGLLGQPTIPTVGEETDDLFSAADFATGEATPPSDDTLTLGNITIAMAVVTSEGDRILKLKPDAPLPYANVLVYWTPSDGEEEIDDGAVFLGQLSGISQRQFTLPKDVPDSRFLQFYSLGQNKAIATVPLPQ